MEKRDGERGVKKTRGGQGDNLAGLAELYRSLLLIRRSEEQLSALFADGQIPGFIHLSIGQEAVAVGVVSQLRSDDTVASTHRGHGHALAKGLSLDGFFAELLGKEAGLCKGRGGSMHVADMSVGMLGANGIVGAGSAIALGSAIAHKTLGRDAIAVAVFGDGSLAEGLLHETLNIASLLSLPLLCVCENNGWSEFSPTHRQISFTLEKLAAAYGIRYVSADGGDVLAVRDAARPLIEAIRQGSGPIVLECSTKRVRGHYEGDAQKYRDAGEIEGLGEFDPIRIAAARLIASGVADKELAEIAAGVDAEIAAAVSFARECPEPDFEAARADVYTGAGR